MRGSSLLAGDIDGYDELAVLVGRDEPDLVGARMAPLGDLDGDGFGELALTLAGYAGDPESVAIVAPATLSGELLVTTAILTEVRSSDRVDGLCTVGDLDGDSLPELVVVGPVDTGTIDDLGQIAVHASSALLAGGVFEPTDAATLIEDPAVEQVGLTATSVGDVDGDGLGDLCVRDPNVGDVAPGITPETGLAIWTAATLASGGVVPSTAADARLVGTTEVWTECPGVPLGDLDADGRGDLLSADYVFGGASLVGEVDPAAAIAWPLDDPHTRRVPMPLGDLTGDGVAELAYVYGYAGKIDPWVRVEVADGASLGPDYTATLLSSAETTSWRPAVRGGTVPDVDGDGIPELWLTLQPENSDTEPYDLRLWSGASVLDGTWSLDVPGGQYVGGSYWPILVALDDLDGDDLAEVAISSPAPILP